MTDNEIAEEWIKNNSYPFSNCPNIEKKLKQAVSYGLKAGRPKWHKVADDDYPSCENDNHYSINVLTDSGDIAYYDYNDDCWVEEPASVEIDPPIAWCEIPKYTEVDK